MKFILYFSFVLVFYLYVVYSATVPTSKFSPSPLRNIQDCRNFVRQKAFRVTKCQAYYKDNQFFLDNEFKFKLLDCVSLTSSITEGVIPVIFYEVKNIEVFDHNHTTAMLNLNGKVQTYLDLIPQIRFFIGPKGQDKDIAKGLTQIYSNVAMAVSELEVLNLYYNQQFFNGLNRSLILSNAQIQYIVLNGWHLRNMDKSPVLRSDFNQLYAAVVIYVTRAHAHLIGKNEVTKWLDKMYMPVLFDMPGSPDNNRANDLLRSPIILFFTLWGILTVYRTILRA